MGYFANSTEAAYWESSHCGGCAFSTIGTCPVLMAHWMWGYDDCNDIKSRLHSMIPRDEDGENGDCFAYCAKEDDDDPRRTEDARAHKWREIMGERKE